MDLPFEEKQNLPPADIRKFAGQVLAAAKDCEALYLPCPQWQAAQTVEELERDSGKPVVAYTHACFFVAFRTMGLTDTIRGHGLDAWVFHATDWYLTDAHAPHAEREARTVRCPPRVVTDLTPVLDRAVKIVGVSDDDTLVERCEAAVRSGFGAHVNAVRSQPYYLDVTHPSATKGVVVQRLSRYARIPLEHIATIGDQANDVPMFLHSGMSIAMGNAPDDVRRQATHVAPSHQDEGFAKAVERYVLPAVA